uniref:NEDD8-activating enzyme E1 regulatory subunit n=1 Tax=Paramormyrops kingsleyae TaxID=1676925 RepID=A0A3B3S023_9TELE
MADGSKGKSTKEQKYDRQLRLWGDHGQDALENAHVCVINATATGTELLKNLVLPGKCSIKQNIKSPDISRFQIFTPDKLLDNDPEFFHRFSLVIGVQLEESTCLRLGAVLWNAGVPFLACRTYGLVGYMRLAVREHTVIESHPDNALEDLRLDQPFTELKNHVQSYNLDNMEKKHHSHTPWIIIVAKYLEKWYNEHNFQLPKNYKEKESFRELIRNGILQNENGVPEDEENFEEAIKNVNTALNPTKVRILTLEIFDGEECKNITSQTPAFWIMARAVKEFVESEGGGNLPVRGTIPDMIADSEKFINLQNVYREKAMQDALLVAKHVESLLQSVGKVHVILLFFYHSKNAAFLRVVHCRSLADEYSVESLNKDEITSCMDSPDCEMVLYLMLRSIDRFHQQHSRYPGVYNYQVEEDIGKLKLCVNSLLQEYGLNVNVKDDYIHEFCRYGASEPHTVASFLGGCAAQEAIKIITHQFVPFNNTFIYNAMSQTSATFQL